MKPSTVKVKLVLIAISYVMLLLFAGGDMLLEIFIAFLFMIPTFFLVRIGAHFETPYGAYSKLLLTLALSAPLCFILVYVGVLPGTLATLCLERLLWSPFILMLIVISRVSARFDRAKRVISYALLSEGLTLCVSIVLISISMAHPN